MPADIALHIEAVARRLLGEPNKKTRDQWRHGKHGSLVVEVAGEHRGTWFDTEINERENEVAV